MKKNMRIIQINGVRGLLISLFVMSCLIAGFVAFPAFLTMNIWNYLAEVTASFQKLNFFQGLLLWAIVAFSFYVFSKRKFIVSVNSQPELTEPELNEMIAKIKSQVIKHQVLKHKELNAKKDINEEIIEHVKELEHKEN